MEFTVTSCAHFSVCARFFRQFIAFFATHQMAMALFRFLGAILKTMVVANTFGMFVLLIVFIFGGFVIPKSKYDIFKHGTLAKLFIHVEGSNIFTLYSDVDR